MLPKQNSVLSCCTLIVFVFPSIIIYVYFICAIFLEAAHSVQDKVLLTKMVQ